MKIEQANEMTAQELCDYTVLKIVEQGGRCLKSDGRTCAMQNVDGTRRCAFSWTLDEEDDVCMNFTGVASSFIIQHPEKTPCEFRDRPMLAGILQKFHDHDLKAMRRKYMKRFQDMGISTDAPQYQQWVDMGEV